MNKQSKKFVLAGLVLLATVALTLAGCKNDSVSEEGTSVPEETWLQEQEKMLDGKTEETHTITAPSYLTEGGLVKTRKLLDGLPEGVLVDLDLSKATGLTYIAAGAFIECSALRSVKLPSSVTEIGNYAFAYTSLTEVTIPGSVTTIGASAFFSCTSLTKVTISEGVTTIGNGAFEYTSLTEVTIPSSVTEIECFAFQGTSLTEVTFQKTDSWHVQDPVTQEIGESIDVSTPATNATNLKDDLGQWYNKNLTRTAAP